MRKIIIISIALWTVVSCSNEAAKVEQVDLSNFKDRLSYVLGADHARAIAESGDKNFEKYDVDQIVKGFEQGLKNDKSFDKSCQATIRSMFGPSGQEFNAKYAQEGSNCIGKLSGGFFINGWRLKKALDKINLSMVIVGFEHSLRKMDTIVPRAEQGSIIQNFITDLNKLNGVKMLDEAKQIKGAVVTKSGIVLETIQAGTGGNPAAGDDVLAHYVLMNAIGDTLQDSYKMVKQYNQPLTPFSLLQVVPGWQEGIPMMKKGGKYRLYLPYNLAYGEQGMFNPQSQTYDIQPFESLKFYIELLDYGKAGSLK